MSKLGHCLLIICGVLAFTPTPSNTETKVQQENSKHIEHFLLEIPDKEIKEEEKEKVNQNKNQELKNISVNQTSHKLQESTLQDGETTKVKISEYTQRQEQNQQQTTKSINNRFTTYQKNKNFIHNQDINDKKQLTNLQESMSANVSESSKNHEKMEMGRNASKNQEKPGMTKNALNGQGEIGMPRNSWRSKDRMGKFLSLFTVVRFRAVSCNGSTEQGVCLSHIKCKQGGGNQIGVCAQGWGVCCSIVVSTCGATLDTNSTYIQNPNFPNSEAGSQTCCYTIAKCDPNICWYRLDMDINTIAQPNIDATNRETNGDCLTDSVSTTCSAGTSFPDNFCGKNDGQHAYLDVCNVNECQICFKLGSGTAEERRWRIKVAQIECNNPWAPPSGCLQYYKGNQGTFCNFGFMDTTSSLHLADQAYGICIRMEKNKCSITYSVSNSVTNNFNLSPPDGQAGAGDNCNADYLIIALATGPSDNTRVRNKFCGKRLSVTDLNPSNEAITTKGKPFIVYYFTNSIEGSTDQNGFCLDYTQNDC